MMEQLTNDQVQAIVAWLNTWEQIKDTAIPVRFKEDFSIKDNAKDLLEAYKYSGPKFITYGKPLSADFMKKLFDALPKGYFVLEGDKIIKLS